jgi:hypothetical protein
MKNPRNHPINDDRIDMSSKYSIHIMRHNDYHHFQPNEDFQYKMYDIQNKLDYSTFGQGFTRNNFLME